MAANTAVRPVKRPLGVTYSALSALVPTTPAPMIRAAPVKAARAKPRSSALAAIRPSVSSDQEKGFTPTVGSSP